MFMRKRKRHPAEDVYKRQVFLTAFYVGKWFPPRKRVDYIVVLGSGLIDGKAVSYTHLDVYKRQSARSLRPAVQGASPSASA